MVTISIDAMHCIMHIAYYMYRVIIFLEYNISHFVSLLDDTVLIIVIFIYIYAIRHLSLTLYDGTLGSEPTLEGAKGAQAPRPSQ